MAEIKRQTLLTLRNAASAHLSAIDAVLEEMGGDATPASSRKRHTRSRSRLAKDFAAGTWSKPDHLKKTKSKTV